jgi:hypothetical protein
MDPQALATVAAETSVSRRLTGLSALVGEGPLALVCAALLEGADPEAHAQQVIWLSGHDATVAELRAKGWHDYWFRTWGARGLLYVWDEQAAPAVVAGLGDEHWRPAEMCLKVSARRELAGAGDPALGLVGHPLPRVRAAAACSRRACRGTSTAGRAGPCAAAARARRCCTSRRW